MRGTTPVGDAYLVAMQLLVLGGTVFLSRAVAAAAVARGHTVVCAARGVSGSAPERTELVVWDRGEPAPAALTARRFDAVVDVARHPSRVHAAVAALPHAHWVFVSSISAYADDATPGGTPSTLPLHEPRTDDADLSVEPEAYGPMKVACEQAVLAGAPTATVVRPGLVVGPGDPSGRYSYWPRRLSEGGRVLAPGRPDDSAQVIDVRDLAEWLVTCAEQRTGGIFDGIGPVTTLGEVLGRTGSAVGFDGELVWMPQEDLEAAGVAPWSGPDSIPLWLPRPAYDGMLAHDATPSLRAGLTVRPLEETARDTLAWLAADPAAPVTGIGREREAELLAGG